MKRLLPFARGRGGVALTLAAVCVAAIAQTDSVNRRIETVLGPAAAYEQVFEQLRSAVAAGDAHSVAALVRYPIRVSVAGDSVTLRSPDDLVRHYPRVFTPAIAAVVTGQDYDKLFVNSQGVMFGDGQVWISGICVKTDCSQVVVKVIAIQGAPAR